ncbi:sigma-70 region 4 domain-containing protein [Paucisalibacillus globulus]|uniref:sigma-70 region 4 domain-containing protein n=1 Tax=Paucisalibacillus globulus TaxID=351095 RepID=UPI000BB98A80|nr:sigma-70 region 4 domain-containing protein [Paucisalibacillus globulus]
MKLTDKQLKLITDIASQNAIKAYREDQVKREKEKHDTRLRNIKLLLKHYRSLVLHCEKLEEDLVKFEDTSIQDLDIKEINLESIESIKQSKTKSLAMVYFVRGKMEAYKRSCDEEEMKYFRVLEMRYITSKKYTIQDIADEENVDVRTVHRYLNRALEELPVIFFGVDAIQFEK